MRVESFSLSLVVCASGEPERASCVPRLSDRFLGIILAAYDEVHAEVLQHPADDYNVFLDMKNGAEKILCCLVRCGRPQPPTDTGAPDRLRDMFAQLTVDDTAQSAKAGSATEPAATEVSLDALMATQARILEQLSSLPSKEDLLRVESKLDHILKGQLDAISQEFAESDVFARRRGSAAKKAASAALSAAEAAETGAPPAPPTEAIVPPMNRQKSSVPTIENMLCL